MDPIKVFLISTTSVPHPRVCHVLSPREVGQLCDNITAADETHGFLIGLSLTNQAETASVKTRFANQLAGSTKACRRCCRRRIAGEGRLRQLEKSGLADFNIQLLTPAKGQHENLTRQAPLCS
jgi:hypothetical protein